MVNNQESLKVVPRWKMETYNSKVYSYFHSQTKDSYFRKLAFKCFMNAQWHFLSALFQPKVSIRESKQHILDVVKAQTGGQISDDEIKRMIDEGGRRKSHVTAKRKSYGKSIGLFGITFSTDETNDGPGGTAMSEVDQDMKDIENG